MIGSQALCLNHCPPEDGLLSYQDTPGYEFRNISLLLRALGCQVRQLSHCLHWTSFFSYDDQDTAAHDIVNTHATNRLTGAPADLMTGLLFSLAFFKIPLQNL